MSPGRDNIGTLGEEMPSTDKTPGTDVETNKQVVEYARFRFERIQYWKANIRILIPLLVLWFAVSFGAGILFVDELNAVNLPGTGFPLGFWFAQQGAIAVFVAIIWSYVWLMNRLDREFGVEED